MKISSFIGSAIIIMLGVMSIAPVEESAAKSAVASPQEVQGNKVGYQVYNNYFESNLSGLKGSTSYLALTDQRAFDKVFGEAAIMGDNRFLPKGSFPAKMVVTVIKRGNQIWTYTVQQVTSHQSTLYVRYNAVAQNGEGATYASPLIISVDRKNYTSVIFIENGKQVGTAKLTQPVKTAPVKAAPAKRPITPPAKAKARGQEVKVYLVALEDNGKRGRKIGCGDSLVAVQRAVSPTNQPLRAALQQLLSLPSEYGGAAKLHNFWQGRDLRLQNVSVTKGTATIRISGDISVAGICDEPRIIEQIEATARQFSSVKKVRVFVGNRTLAQAIR